MPPSLPNPAKEYAPLWLRDHAAWLLVRLGVHYQDLAGSARPSRIVRARQLMAYVLRHWEGRSGIIPSYPEIARVMGKTNHSSIIFSYRMANKERRGKGPHATWAWNDLDDIKPAELLAEAIASEGNHRLAHASGRQNGKA